MSFKSTLVLGNNSYNVLSFSMNIHQQTDQYGVPRDRVSCDVLSIVIESSGKDDEISEWATSPKMKKNGQVTFFKRDASAIGKTIAFEDAYCIGYNTDYSDNEGVPMTLKIMLSAMCVKINHKYVVKTPVYTNGSKGGSSGSASSSGSTDTANAPIASFIAD